MNLALVTETFPPEINGVAMTLSHLVEGLCERKHRVTVFRPRQKGEKGVTGAEGLPYEQRLAPGLPIPGYSTMRIGLPVYGRLVGEWKKSRPDLVHVATEGPLGWAALSAAQSLDLPVTSSFHTNFHSYSRHYGVPFLTRPVLAYLRWFHNRTRVTLSPTEELNRQLTAEGFVNVRLLARGVDTELFARTKRDPALRASWGAGPDDLVVIHVSRVAAEKNFPLLLRAFAAIRERDPRAKFVITSDGPLRKKLQRAHPWIHFTGLLERGDLARHYASADLFLYPSLTETFGNVALEAMASALPIVAFDYAAAGRYLRHGESAWLVPFGDSDQFVTGAQTLAGDPALRRRLGPAARRLAGDIPWDRVIDGFETDLVAAARRPAAESDPSFVRMQP